MTTGTDSPPTGGRFDAASSVASGLLSDNRTAVEDVMLAALAAVTAVWLVVLIPLRLTAGTGAGAGAAEGAGEGCIGGGGGACCFAIVSTSRPEIHKRMVFAQRSLSSSVSAMRVNVRPDFVTIRNARSGSKWSDELKSGICPAGVESYTSANKKLLRSGEKQNTPY